LAEKTVLVVDDDESMVRAISIKLRTEGYKVIAALDAMQAIMMTHNKHPDAIIMDIRLPAGSGLDVMERLHNSIKTSGIPIIVITGSDLEEDRRRAEELKAYRFFKKPFETEELIMALKEALP